jgi:hypothetical protein
MAVNQRVRDAIVQLQAGAQELDLQAGDQELNLNSEAVGDAGLEALATVLAAKPTRRSRR